MNHKVKIFSFVIAIMVLLSSVGTPVLAAPYTALPNPGAIIPVPSGAYAKYSQGPHLSGFGMGYMKNGNQVTSSIDLGYSGTVVAPIAGKIMIAKDCGDHQIVFINADRGSDGSGWSIGLTHIHIASGLKDGSPVTQGQVIGKTVKPLAKPGKGCGYGSGMHIHYTLMKWKMATNGPVFTEQNIVNTYIGQWIVKNTYLNGSDHDVKLGQTIK
jgi:hypothetical protein